MPGPCSPPPEVADHPLLHGKKRRFLSRPPFSRSTPSGRWRCRPSCRKSANGAGKLAHGPPSKPLRDDNTSILRLGTHRQPTPCRRYPLRASSAPSDSGGSGVRPNRGKDRERHPFRLLEMRGRQTRSHLAPVAVEKCGNVIASTAGIGLDANVEMKVAIDFGLRDVNFQQRPHSAKS